jgi:hypothetical protein
MLSTVSGFAHRLRRFDVGGARNCLDVSHVWTMVCACSTVAWTHGNLGKVGAHSALEGKKERAENSKKIIEAI